MKKHEENATQVWEVQIRVPLMQGKEGVVTVASAWDHLLECLRYYYPDLVVEHFDADIRTSTYAESRCVITTQSKDTRRLEGEFDIFQHPLFQDFKVKARKIKR